MQNVSQGYKVKVAKFHVIIFWRFGVIKKKPQEGGICPSLVQIGLSVQKETPGALVFSAKFLEIYSMLFKLNLILNPYREYLLIHKVLLQILLILGKDQIFL